MLTVAAVAVGVTLLLIAALVGGIFTALNLAAWLS